jgi:hypothetical protein
MPRITARTASDIMIWSVPIEIRQKSRVLLAYSNPSRNRKKTANTGCLMRWLRYSVFKRSTGSRQENVSKRRIRASVLILIRTEQRWCLEFEPGGLERLRVS